jgi:hypothetical protein
MTGPACSKQIKKSLLEAGSFSLDICLIGYVVS